ncbi:MAG TPA: hypothetical protein VGP72_06600 [Planctomycetota bacterium]|jgi:CheY-like chemotaxis protein
MPRAYIAEPSGFRAAVIKDYCLRRHLEALCMQNPERVLEEALQSNPAVIFLQASVLQQHQGLIGKFRSAPATRNAAIILLSSRLDVAPPGINLVVESAAGLAQLDPIIQRMQSNVPRAVVVSAFVRANSPLVQTLTASGYQVFLAATGSKGLKHAAEQTPRLVLVDGKLMDMPVPDFCRRLREGDPKRSVSLYVLLPKPDGAIEQACRDATADGLLLPPFHDPKNLALLGITRNT